MKFKFQFEELKNVLGVLSSITSDTTMDEQFKNFFFVAKKEEGMTEQNVVIGTHTATLINSYEVKAEVISEETDLEGLNIFLLDSKSIMNVLKPYTSLSLTVATTVELELNSEGLDADTFISEEPIDKEDETRQNLYQRNQLKTRTRVLGKITKDKVNRLVTYDKTNETTESPKKLLGYLATLVPVVLKEKNVQMSNIMFSEDLVYTLSSTHGTSLTNILSDKFKNVRLRNKNAEILKDFIGSSDQLFMQRIDSGKGQVTLIFRKEAMESVLPEGYEEESVSDNEHNSILIIECAELVQTFDMTAYTQLSENVLKVDRDYMMDILKRLELSSKPSVVQVKIEPDKAEMVIKNDIVNLEVPIQDFKGLGEYSFRIMPKVLRDLLIGHIRYMDTINLHLEEEATGKTFLGVDDDSNFWKTKSTTLDKSNAKFNF